MNKDKKETENLKKTNASLLEEHETFFGEDFSDISPKEKTDLMLAIRNWFNRNKKFDIVLTPINPELELEKIEKHFRDCWINGNLDGIHRIARMHETAASDLPKNRNDVFAARAYSLASQITLTNPPLRKDVVKIWLNWELNKRKKPEELDDSDVPDSLEKLKEKNRISEEYLKKTHEFKKEESERIRKRVRDWAKRANKQFAAPSEGVKKKVN